VPRPLLALLLAVACTPPPPTLQPVDNVTSLASPLMGSGGFGWGAGSAFPGASVPHGLAKVGPDTIGMKYGAATFLHFAGYWYGDETIRGFSQLHLHGTGASDYGAVTLAPVTQSLSAPYTADTYGSTYAKSSEHASPGSYAVHLDAWKVDVELTASTHVAWHRYTWAAGQSPRVVLDLNRVLPPGTMQMPTVAASSGSVLKGSVLILGGMSTGFGGNQLFFELRANRPWTTLDTSNAGQAVMDFDLSAPVVLAMGLSLVSADGATKNIDGEAPSIDFDAAKNTAVAQWKAMLERVTVYGVDPQATAAFYSALHHAFVMPTVISDVDNTYVFKRPATFSAPSRTFSDFSLWDTYRTVHPLYALIAPDSDADSVNSLVRQAQAWGGFTRWPLGTGETGTMLGSPADIVIADAALRGVDGPDYAAAYAMLRDRALRNVPPEQLGTRYQSPSYPMLGYVPYAEDDRAGSLTLEYAAADFALSNLAAQQGDATNAALFTDRAHGWRKLWDPSLQLLHPLNADGTFAYPMYDVTSWNDGWAESDAYESTFQPIHDVDGLAQLFGSKEAVVTALDAFFQATLPELDALAKQDYEARNFPNAHYFAGNEPDIQAPFMFSLMGRADLTAKWSVWARNKFYSIAPDGEPGNDDGGALASWYVFAMLGLYPLPGSDEWIVGSPAFPKVELKVNGGVFTIEADGVSDKAIYVQSLELDGKPLDGAVLHHAQLKAGSKLVAKMGEMPKAF
jgi:predicted alpha-1,2-mannosidase